MGQKTDFIQKIEKLEAENLRLRMVLDPKIWSEEQKKAWHQGIPDVQKAFDNLRESSK